MDNVLMCSGGKDSVATLIVALENNIKIDCCVFTEVMFDKNISGEHPLHIDFIYNKLKPFVETELKIPFYVLRSNKTYCSIFNERITGQRCSVPERIGKKKGFPLGKGCVIRRELKLKPVADFRKKNGIFNELVGIAFDEKDRLISLHKNINKVSLLEKYSVIEKDCFSLCRSYGLLSPLYDIGCLRQGCWFCPNCSLKTFAFFKKSYPDLWNKLKLLSYDKELVSCNFRYSKSFLEVDNLIDMINNQISIFDL